MKKGRKEMKRENGKEQKEKKKRKSGFQMLAAAAVINGFPFAFRTDR